MDGTVVSRRDLFDKFEENPDNNHAVAAVDYALPSFEFEEVSHEAQEIPAEENDAEPEVLEFQLFGGSGPVQVDLNIQEEEPRQGRPLSYYVFRSSSETRAKALAAAVSGSFVLNEADAWAKQAARNPLAEDVNAEWRPPKRRCRPGKDARLKKRQRNQRIEAERKAAAEEWRQRRRSAKPRGPPRSRLGPRFVPKSGFTFK